MENCNDAALYESLKYCPGQAVLSGVRLRAFGAPKTEIMKFPVLPGKEAASMGDKAVLTGEFVMAADAKWRVIMLTPNKGQVTWEPQGEPPSATFLNKVTLPHPNIDEDAAGFSRQVLNDDWVFVVQQRDGKCRVVGNDMFPTIVKPSGGTGEGSTGEVGSSFEVQADDICPAPFYTGTLETDEGTFDCSTGAFATE